MNLADIMTLISDGQALYTELKNDGTLAEVTTAFKTVVAAKSNPTVQALLTKIEPTIKSLFSHL